MCLTTRSIHRRHYVNSFITLKEYEAHKLVLEIAVQISRTLASVISDNKCDHRLSAYVSDTLQRE